MAKKENSSDFLASVENFYMGLAGALPMMKPWLSMFFHPVETFNSMKKSATFGGMLVNLVLLAVIEAVLVGIIMLPFSVMGESAPGLIVAGIYAGAVLVLVPVLAFLSYVVYYLAAKLLGGKGGFSELGYAFSLLALGMFVVSLPFHILGIIPCIGTLFSLVAVAVSLYVLYSEYLLIKSIHGLSTIRSIVVLFSPLIIAFVIIAILLVVAGLFIGSLIGGLASGMAAGGVA